MQQLSRSVGLMFLFDLMTLLVSTTLWYNYFSLPVGYKEFIIFLTVFTGLVCLFLKERCKLGIIANRNKLEMKV